jgi:hypothetical protein
VPDEVVELFERMERVYREHEGVWHRWRSGKAVAPCHQMPNRGSRHPGAAG